MTEQTLLEGALEAAALTDIGTERGHNEDAFGLLVEGPACTVAVVADGVSQAAAGELASRMAVDVTLRAFQEEPKTRPPGQRLYRAVQQANIEIHDKAMAVPELHGMTTTLIAAVINNGEVTAVHVGDSRLYLVRDGRAEQLTKDHTVAAEKARFGLMSKERARQHPDRSVLTRSVGRELIVSRDRLVRPLVQHDVLVLCTDGLHGVLEDQELAKLVTGRSAEEACRALIETANARGTSDNLTAAVLCVRGPTPHRADAPTGIMGRLKGLFGSG